jgi:hypothetical protein
MLYEALKELPLWVDSCRLGYLARTSAHARYVKLHITAIMCRSKLCGVRIARRLKFA